MASSGAGISFSRHSGPQTTRFIIAVALAGLVGANALWLLPSLRDARENAARLRLEIAGRAADSIAVFMQSKMKSIAEAAEDLRFAERRTDAVLARLLKSHPEFNSVTLLDRELREINKFSRFDVVSPGSLRPRPEFSVLLTLAPGKIYAGEVVRSKNLEPIITLAAVMEADGRFPAGGGERRFLVGELNLKSLSELVSRFRFVENSKVYIISGDGTLIIDPDVSLVLKRPNLSAREIVRDIISRKSAVPSARHYNEAGVKVEASAVFLSSFQWGVIAEEDLAAVNALRNRILLLALISLSIGVALVAALVATGRTIAQANLRLHELLRESYESAKMLIRRDRELVLTNTRLTELLAELESVGKMLVRRDLELSRANARLIELDEIKSEFVSIAAHQLRTPLTGIRWSYQTLLEDGSGAWSAEQRRLLESGLGATLRMIDLVNDLLSVARIEEGRFGIQPRKQSIAPLIGQLAERYAALAKEKGVKFELQLPEKALPELAIDEERIGLVLDNLLENALKYTEPGGKITLRVAPEGDKVRVEVKDTGIGISKEQLHRVFTKFFRADNAIRLHTSGTGLGLYVAKNIIDQHGGKLTVESTEGKGSTFAFTLPIV